VSYPFILESPYSLVRRLPIISLIPISILRLVSLNKALHSESVLFDYATAEIYTQAEMCANVLCATIPSLQVLLASAHTGLLDLGATTTSHNRSTYGCGSAAAQSSIRNPRSFGGMKGASVRPRNEEPEEEREEEEIELTRLHGGGTALASVSSCRAKDNASVSSDGSGMAIRVKQTVDLHYSK
jgi:hypothetical protein